MTSISSTSAPSFSWNKINDNMSKDSLKLFFKDAGTIDEERFKGFENLIFTGKWLSMETKEELIHRFEKLVVKQNIPLVDVAIRISILKNIGLLSPYCKKEGCFALATNLAQELSSQGASRDLKLYFAELLWCEGFNFDFLRKENNQIYEILNFNQHDINEIIFNKIVKNEKYGLANKDCELIINSIINFIQNSTPENTIIFLKWCNTFRYLENPIIAARIDEILSRLIFNDVELLYQHLMNMLESNNIVYCDYFFKTFLSDKQFSIREFDAYVNLHSEKKETVHQLLRVICGPFGLQYPFLSTDTLETRILLGEQALRENPNLMSLNFSYLFSEEEIVNDLGVNGPIAGLIESCLESVEIKNNQTYLQLTRMYYERLLRERTSSSQIERDSHLYLYLGEEPDSELKGNNVFMARPEYDSNIQRFFRSKRSIEFKNPHSVNLIIAPAVEISAGLFPINDITLTNLGFKLHQGGSGTFMIIPDPTILEQRWEEMVKLPAYTHLPRSIKIAHVHGIVSSREFVKLYQEHTAVIADDEELHDIPTHFAPIVENIVKDPVLYEQVRALAKEITQEILDVCDRILKNSPSQYDLDMVAFLEETAGILYDSGTSFDLNDWKFMLDSWKCEIPFAEYWETENEFYRRGLRKRVPNDLDYTPEMISNYWTEKKNLMNLAKQT